MNTNYYFEKGSSHDICQDYALTGQINDNLHYLIISDGCSSSHEICKQVDLGARILVHCAKKTLLNGAMVDRKSLEGTSREGLGKLLSETTLAYAHSIAEQMMLPPMALDATLLICVSDVNKSYVYIYGDGGLVVQQLNGNLYYTEVSFASGAPYYLSYALDAAREKGYASEFGDAPLTVTNYEFRTSFEDPTVHTQVINQNTKVDRSIYPKLSYEVKGASIITLVSDGVKSFQSFPDGGSVIDIPSSDMIREVAGFKNTQGNFVERRIHAMKRQLEKTKTNHYDDLSVASVVL